MIAQLAHGTTLGLAIGVVIGFTAAVAVDAYDRHLKNGPAGRRHSDGRRRRGAATDPPTWQAR